MSDLKLTGRRRYRHHTRLSGKSLLVVQVEVAGTDVRFLGGSVEHVNVRYWRDARVEDLSEHERP